MGVVKTQYIPGFDGLRALAIIGVVGSHLNLPGFAVGWIGVALFFVLSGYLITRLLLAAKGEPDFISRFYMRRAVRIFPIYYLTFSAIILVGMIKHWELADWPWFAVYLQNWKLSEGTSIFPHFFNHTWSLAVEEQFYILWPFVVLLLSRRGLMAAAAVIITVSPLARFYFAAEGMTPWWAFPFDTLAWGALGALIPNERRFLNVAPLCLLLTSIATVAAYVFEAWSLLQALYGPLFVTLLLLIKSGQIPNRLLEWTAICYIGRISYGIYLYHGKGSTADVW